MKTNAFVTLVLSLFIQKHYTAIPQVFAFIRTSPTRLLQTPTHTKSHSLLTVINKHGNISSTRLSLKRKLTIVNQSPTNQLQDINDGVSQQHQDVDFVIVGAGPAGLLSSIMLATKFPEKTINVYDRLSEPPSPTDESVWSDVARFYLIGLGARGQTALKKYNVWGDVKNVCTSVVGRKDWGPDFKADEGVECIFTDRPVTTEVLPRDKLVGVLHKHVIDNYAGKINLNYGYEVTPETFDSEDGKGVIVRVSKCSETVVRMNPTTVTDSNKDVLCDIDDSFTLNTELLIAADGTSRTIANAIEKDQQEKKKSMNIFQKLLSPKQFHVKRYVDDNQRVYKTIPFKAPSGWRPDLNYSARSKGGRINFDALPADRNGSYCGVLLVRANDEVAAANTDPKVLRALMDEKLPQFSSLLDDESLAAIAKKPPSFLPSFRYAGPQLHYGDHTLILGDCAHTVKPYFGLGANSALEDVKVSGFKLMHRYILTGNPW
jgi:2-polyprenyl-6-methoxyphenol hydroxylase-like FAD-dependent oxidoreductase